MSVSTGLYVKRADPIEAFLAAHHRTMLEAESGISPQMISDRGYFTATDPDELGRLGFAEYQCLTPALVVPSYDIHGGLRLYRARPDSPRRDLEKPEKVIKYEQPAGTGVSLDVPPSAFEALKDPDTPLWIVEGEKKADALCSHGLCAIGLFGAWAWKRGGLPLSDWDSIAIVGRKVFIAFDSDAERKVEVRRARLALAEYLKERGAVG
jgi:uncharacterized protein DUF3854